MEVNILSGSLLTFTKLHTFPAKTKDRMSALVKRLGGKVSESKRTAVLEVALPEHEALSEDEKSLLEKYQLNVVRVAWLEECDAAGAKVPQMPRYGASMQHFGA